MRIKPCIGPRPAPKELDLHSQLLALRPTRRSPHLWDAAQQLARICRPAGAACTRRNGAARVPARRVLDGAAWLW